MLVVLVVRENVVEEALIASCFDVAVVTVVVLMVVEVVVVYLPINIGLLWSWTRESSLLIRIPLSAGT